MKKIAMCLAILMSANMAHALAVGGGAVAGSFLALSSSVAFSLSKDKWDKVLVNAKGDAQLFVATDGEVRGAQLSQALEMIRSANPNAAVSDMDLALEIIQH